jgi:hypothetical protein
MDGKTLQKTSNVLSLLAMNTAVSVLLGKTFPMGLGYRSSNDVALRYAMSAHSNSCALEADG